VRFASIVIATVALGGVAGADNDTGASLFEQGRALSQQGKYKEACERFAKSYELEPATGTQVNFADCEEHLGHIARAWQLFDATATAADRENNAMRAQYARQRANVLVPRLAGIVIRVAAPDPRMTIRLGDRAISPVAEIKTYVDPGDVEIVAELGGRRFQAVLAARAGATATVDVPRLGESADAGGPAGGKRRTWMIASASLAIAGLAGMSASALLTLSASRRYADAFAEGDCMHAATGAQCTQAGLERVNAARSRANLATGVFIGSAALVAGAVVTYVLAPRDSIEIAPTATNDSAGVTISGAF
jgi:hypothetical protein